MSIASDFSIDTDNRILKHYTGGTVYAVNDLYSYIQDYFDELIAMTVTVPMSAQTPTEYSLINGWFIPEDTFKYLRTGAVKTLGWDTTTFSDGVMITVFGISGYISAVPTDIGKVVTDGTNTGILLDYNNTLRKWWIRKTSVLPLITAVTIPTGTGAGTISSLGSGESLFTNVYTLGALDPLITNTLFVEQVNAELSNNQVVQYWPAGHIDLIVKVKEASTLINSGFVRVYCREYTDLYSHFSIDLSGGGRNPVPLGTSSDSNNQTASVTVASWSDVTITFGTITRDLLNGTGPQTYDCEIDCGTRISLNQVYQRLKLVTARNSGFTINGNPGQFYRLANIAYGENTTSPFGTFAGGQFFGAQGIFIKNVPIADINNYKLINSSGTTQTPPFVSGITLAFSSNLSTDGSNSNYRLFFKQINKGVSAAFGTTNAILVQKADNLTEISGTLAGNISAVTADFDYDGNTQAAWLPNTLYLLGDNYRYLQTWYKVSSSYVSGADFSITDTTNSALAAGPDVVLVAIGRTTAQFITVSGTIGRSVSNSIAASSATEVNFSAPAHPA